MSVKLKVNLPVQNIATNSLPVEVELDDKGLGGALAMLIQQKTGLDDTAVGNLMTDNEGNIYTANSAREIEEKIIAKDASKAALVDAMNALVYGKPKKIGEHAA